MNDQSGSSIATSASLEVGISGMEDPWRVRVRRTIQVDVVAQLRMMVMTPLEGAHWPLHTSWSLAATGPSVFKEHVCELTWLSIDPHGFGLVAAPANGYLVARRHADGLRLRGVCRDREDADQLWHLFMHILEKNGPQSECMV